MSSKPMWSVVFNTRFTGNEFNNRMIIELFKTEKAAKKRYAFLFNSLREEGRNVISNTKFSISNQVMMAAVETYRITTIELKQVYSRTYAVHPSQVPVVEGYQLEFK